MAGSKAKRLGLKQQVFGIEEPARDKLDLLRKKFEEIGFTVGIGG